MSINEHNIVKIKKAIVIETIIELCIYNNLL